jgi:hypothetical protein
MILWRRLDQPGHDACRVVDRSVEGTAVTAFDGRPCSLVYRVECDEQWRTRSARVTGWIGSETVDVTITVDEHGRWRLNEVEQPALDGCLDVDLSFTPATNTLPIRRLGLRVGREARVDAAWLRFPELVMERLDQVYHRAAEHTWRYSSQGGSFTATIEVDAEGVVQRYEGLWVRE